MKKPINFQTISMKLQSFWAERGCLIWQPYYTQVGAGTMNPATYLRVLGPEPWNVAYVEPSIRPDDGRYGENPNRMQMHYQFQVILKPDPGNPQDQYLESLQVLGIDPHRHDIRFVEDNWEQPMLGAWGLGWEVWLDGQEITQFTYFQQAGGINLDPVAVELTYGLERIAIALQKVAGFTEIDWNGELTDGDVNLQAEQEHSRYYFDTADIEKLRQMFENFYAEAELCLDQGLVLPAYDYILKCSHTFNVLDTRGAVGVTERQAVFGRIRELARRVSGAYINQREELGFPFLEKISPLVAVEQEKVVESATPMVKENAPLLIEIGTEELPSADLEGALSQLEKAVPGWLSKLRLEHGNIRFLGTPRRIVVYVEDLAAKQHDLEQVAKGPPAERAFDPDGKPTKAAIGFARSKGIPVEDLQILEMDGGRYAAAPVKQIGHPAWDVLSKAIPDLIEALRFDKSMRWNRTNVAFSRPVRWLVGLHGSSVVPFEYAGLRSDRVTRGLRFNNPELIRLEDTEKYFKELADQGIILDPDERKQEIGKQVERLAAEVGCAAQDDPALLDEVTNLVEAPSALRGEFERAHLALPRRVLTAVMKKHQRYFPLFESGVEIDDAEGEAPLAPYFIAVRNGGLEGMEEVIEGNEHVIRARFADADFFVRDDLKQSLEAYLPKLDSLTFQVKLGSMLDKTARITSLVAEISEELNLEESVLKTAKRAAQLCKADLATSMVVEMTSLQGYMGSYYAQNSGEPSEVARAIYEHYLPRFAGDRDPETLPGLVVGLADRLDSLAGLFAAGLAPSGNKDPFALRRAALGLVGNLIEWHMSINLEDAITRAADLQPIEVDLEIRKAVLDFIVERQRNVLLGQGAKYDVIDAVLAQQGRDPALAAQAVGELSIWVNRSDWKEILPAYSRCVRITRDFEERFEFNPDLELEPAERELYEALKEAEAVSRKPGSVDDFLNAFQPLIPAVNLFFDDVLVMVEDKQVRENRLGLLQRVAVLADGVADMSRLEGF